MGFVLRWLEEPYACEVVTRGGDRMLLMVSTDGRVVWEEAVPSASAAWDRAREIRDRLLSAGRKRA
jgi:hypothetical protein